MFQQTGHESGHADQTKGTGASSANKVIGDEVAHRLTFDLSLMVFALSVDGLWEYIEQLSERCTEVKGYGTAEYFLGFTRIGEDGRRQLRPIEEIVKHVFEKTVSETIEAAKTTGGTSAYKKQLELIKKKVTAEDILACYKGNEDDPIEFRKNIMILILKSLLRNVLTFWSLLVKNFMVSMIFLFFLITAQLMLENLEKKLILESFSKKKFILMS